MGANAGRAGSAGFKVDVSRGERLGRVSSEWFSRPDDERFLSLPELYEAVRARADRAEARTVESRAIRVEARRDDGERLALIVPGQERPVAPTHWSFGQLCGLVGAPAGYLRELPAPLAGINLQHGLLNRKRCSEALRLQFAAAGFQHQGMSWSIWACGQPLTRRVSRSVK